MLMHVCDNIQTKKIIQIIHFKRCPDTIFNVKICQNVSVTYPTRSLSKTTSVMDFTRNMCKINSTHMRNTF